MYTVCYVDKSTNEHKFASTSDYANYINQLKPTENVVFVYDERANILQRNDKYEQMLTSAGDMYGIDPNNLHCKYADRNGTVFELLGLNTRNRRYKVIIRDAVTGKTMKVTTKYFAGLTKLP